VIKILIQRADRLGDLVLALPVLERLNETLPHAELHLLVSPIGKPLAATLPFIKKMIVTHSAKKKRSYWKLIQSIKHEHYSLYLSLWNHPKMAYLGFLAQIPIRIGDATNPTLRWLYTHPVPQSWKNFCKHQAFFNMELLKPLHSNALLLTKKLYINSATEEKVRLLMLKSLNPNKRVVLIFTDSGGSNLSLPEHAIKTFCDRLLENQLFNIVLIGGKQKGLSPLCFYKAKDVLNLLDHPSLPLPELMAFIKLSDFYVGPDTGPTHIASFLEKPILYFSALKSNPPSRWGPLSSYFSIIRKDYLSPHFCKPSCNPRICLHYMTGDLLYTHFQSLLLQVQKRLPLSEKEQETRERIERERREAERENRNYMHFGNNAEVQINDIAFDASTGAAYFQVNTNRYTVHNQSVTRPRIIPALVTEQRQAGNFRLSDDSIFGACINTPDGVWIKLADGARTPAWFADE